jgi:hypothetical protein
MRASTAVAILYLAAGVAPSIALPLPAIKYASLLLHLRMVKFYPSLHCRSQAGGASVNLDKPRALGLSPYRDSPSSLSSHEDSPSSLPPEDLLPPSPPYHLHTVPRPGLGNRYRPRPRPCFRTVPRPMGTRNRPHFNVCRRP